MVDVLADVASGAASSSDHFAVVAGVVTAVIVAAFGYLSTKASVNAKRARREATDAQNKTKVTDDHLADVKQANVLSADLLERNRRRIEELALGDGTVDSLLASNMQLAEQVLAMSASTSDFMKTQTEALTRAEQDKARLSTQLTHATVTLERVELALAQSETRRARTEEQLERSSAAVEASNEQLRLCEVREGVLTARVDELIALHHRSPDETLGG